MGYSLVRANPDNTQHLPTIIIMGHQPRRGGSVESVWGPASFGISTRTDENNNLSFGGLGAGQSRGQSWNGQSTSASSWPSGSQGHGSFGGSSNYNNRGFTGTSSQSPGSRSRNSANRGFDSVWGPASFNSS